MLPDGPRAQADGAAPRAAADSAAELAAADGRRPADRSKWLLTAGKVALSLLAIVVVLRTVDLPSAWHRMQHQDLRLAALAAAVMVGQIVFGGLRWHVIVRRLGGHMRIDQAVRLFYIAVFFNACLWGAVAGDVVRAWLAHRDAMEMRTAVNSVLLDRVAPLCAVALLVLATLPIFAERTGFAVAAIPAVLSLGGIAGIFVVATLHRLPKSWQHNRFIRLLQSLGSATRLVFLKPAAAVPMLAIAIAGQIAASLAAYLIARSLSIDVGLLDCLALMQPVTLVTALPISIGGWGVREATIVMLFALVGVSSEAALALSVQIGLINLLVSLPGGILWLLSGSRRGKDATHNLGMPV